MKLQHLILILFLAAFCTGCTQTNDAPVESKSIKLETNGIPFGTLGYPVGSYLTIEGVKEKPQILGNQHWLVDTVNGNKLARPVSIVIQTANGSTNGARHVFKGFETLQMIGTPPGYIAAAKEARRRDIVQEQSSWQLLYYFTDTSAMASTKTLMLYGFKVGVRADGFWPVMALVQIEASQYEEVTNRSDEISKVITARLAGLEKEEIFTNKTQIERDILKQVDQVFPAKTPLVHDIMLESQVQ